MAHRMYRCHACAGRIHDDPEAHNLGDHHHIDENQAREYGLPLRWVGHYHSRCCPRCRVGWEPGADAEASFNVLFAPSD